jgi:hypothetical protein
VALLLVVIVPRPARGQAEAAARLADALPAPTGESGEAASQHGLAVSFLSDVVHDYRNFFSVETAWWLGGGGAAAGGVHQADQTIADWVQSNVPSMPGSELFGSQLVQIPVAIVWWWAGSAAGSAKQADTGRDLLRAQVLVAGWTYGIKVAAHRTRPNGEPWSFPSGHASTSFALASVLQDHFGWKVGLPAFAAAAYTGASRVADNWHWTSDVVFGAALGIAAGRTVTLHLRDTKVTLSPLPVPGGIGVTVTALR